MKFHCDFDCDMFADSILNCIVHPNVHLITNPIVNLSMAQVLKLISNLGVARLANSIRIRDMICEAPL